jgi:hypothetical protein
MVWSAFILALIEMLTPYALEWLRELLRHVEDIDNGLLADCPADPALAVHDCFAACRARLTLWDRMRGRGRVLAACERVALSHAGELARRARGEREAVVLTTAEFEKVTA